ncbi:MAG: DNA-directed RNA polymerase subunit L [Candidatus Woesearchaeota archaeon]
MEIKVIESEKNRLVIDIVGEGHALTNSLKKELWNDKDVTISGYHVEHPQIGIPRMIIETKKSGKTPQKAIQDACSRLKKQNENFLDKFKKEIK